MTRSYAPLLLFLAAIWGASYLFIKVGVRDFEPSFFIDMRLWIAGLLLFAFLALREGGREAVVAVRSTWREGLIFGTINGALPFMPAFAAPYDVPFAITRSPLRYT